jgi:hypothetical protein
LSAAIAAAANTLKPSEASANAMVILLSIVSSLDR